jgi:hypothetical protein
LRIEGQRKEDLRNGRPEKRRLEKRRQKKEE